MNCALKRLATKNLINTNTANARAENLATRYSLLKI